MKIKIIVESIVDTDDYSDVKTPSDALSLIVDAIDNLADWPKETIVKNEFGEQEKI